MNNMMRKPLLIIVGMLLALLVVGCSQQTAQVAQKTLLDRVLEKREIRCGYIPWPPFTIMDPNTGNVTGIFTELMEKIGENAGLKIVWAEQAEWGTAIEGMKGKRYDMLCSGIWPNTARAKQASFSVPVNFSVVEAYVRVDDDRFSDLSQLNSEDVTISTIDGEMAQSIAQTDFPKAGQTGLPQMSDTAQLYLQVVNNKADVVLHDLVTAEQFMEKNPGTLKRLASGTPLRVFPNVYMVPKGEREFRDFFNVALQELHNIGYVQKVLEKYDARRGTYPVATPYQAEN